MPRPHAPRRAGLYIQDEETGYKFWGPMIGGHMFTVDGTTCQSGPFNLIIRPDEEVKWMVETSKSRTKWKAIRN